MPTGVGNSPSQRGDGDIIWLRTTGNGSKDRPSQPPPALGVGKPMSKRYVGVSTKAGSGPGGESLATTEP